MQLTFFTRPVWLKFCIQFLFLQVTVNTPECSSFIKKMPVENDFKVLVMIAYRPIQIPSLLQ